VITQGAGASESSGEKEKSEGLSRADIEQGKSGEISKETANDPAYQKLRDKAAREMPDASSEAVQEKALSEFYEEKAKLEFEKGLPEEIAND